VQNTLITYVVNLDEYIKGDRKN